MSADTLPVRQPPYLALPMGMTADECMMLTALARQIAVDDGEYIHTKNAAAEGQQFLAIAIRANARGDHGATHAALLRAASIAMGALVALEARHAEAQGKVRAMHEAGAERIVAMAPAGRRLL
jgi:hypothetical protein